MHERLDFPVAQAHLSVRIENQPRNPCSLRSIPFQAFKAKTEPPIHISQDLSLDVHGMRVDQESFLSDRFDVNAYANAVLAGKVYKPDEEDAGISQASTGEKGDVGVELAKLNLGIVRESSGDCASH